jgi:hypothetical protein
MKHKINSYLKEKKAKVVTAAIKKLIIAQVRQHFYENTDYTAAGVHVATKELEEALTE